MKKSAVVILSAVLSMGTAIAAPNLKMDQLGVAKLAEMAGDKSPYYIIVQKKKLSQKTIF